MGNTGFRRPGATGPPTHRGAVPADTPPVSPSLPTSPARGQWLSRARYPMGRACPPPARCSMASADRGVIPWTPRSSSTSCGTRIASGPQRSAEARRRRSTRCPCNGFKTVCACADNTPSTLFGLPGLPSMTAMRCCTKRTRPRPRTGSYRTRHTELTIVSHDGHLDLWPPTLQTLSTVAQQTQLDNVLTHRGHTPLGAAHATAYVHTQDLTARPPTTGPCGPETATQRCNAGSATGKSRALASQSSRSRASSVAARKRPQCTCTSAAPTPGSLAPLLPGSTRGGPTPPAWEQSAMDGFVALCQRRADGGLMPWAGARSGRSAAPHDYPLQPAKRGLRRGLHPTHAPAGGLHVVAPQPTA